VELSRKAAEFLLSLGERLEVLEVAPGAGPSRSSSIRPVRSLPLQVPARRSLLRQRRMLEGGALDLVPEEFPRYNDCPRQAL